MRKETPRSQRPYTTGELNRLLDALLHPLAKSRPELLFLDGIVHGIIEQNPSESTVKFIQHNLPKLLPQLMRNRKRR